MHKIYTLKTMVDMFQIPEDRFEEFIIDLKQWHKVGRSFNDLAQSISKAVGEELPSDFMTMKWTDDDKHSGPVKITIHKPKEARS